MRDVMRRCSAIVFAAALGAIALPANAQSSPFSSAVPPVSAVGILTTVQSVVSVPLASQSVCSTGIVGGPFSATVTFEATNDGANWFPVIGTPSTATTATTTASAIGLYVSPVASDTGFRARVSTYASGAVTIVILCTGANPGGLFGGTGGSGGGSGGAVTQSTNPWTIGGSAGTFSQDGSNRLNVNCVVGCSASVNPYGAAPQTTTANSYLGVVAQYNSSLPTFTTGQSGALQLDVNGRLLTSSVGGSPLTGGSTGVATAANQGVAIHYYNGTTLDAVQGSGGAINTHSNLQAGTNIVGKFGIDSTTPGITNGVVLNGTLPAFTTTPTFNCNTGCTVPLPIAPHLLTSASTTTCTSINTGAQQLGALINANAAAQTVSLVLYDEGASPGCLLADARATITFGQGQFIQTGFIGLSFINGLAYTLSGAPQAGAPIVIQSTK